MRGERARPAKDARSGEGSPRMTPHETAALVAAGLVVLFALDSYLRWRMRKREEDDE